KECMSEYPMQLSWQLPLGGVVSSAKNPRLGLVVLFPLSPSVQVIITREPSGSPQDPLVISSVKRRFVNVEIDCPLTAPIHIHTPSHPVKQLLQLDATQPAKAVRNMNFYTEKSRRRKRLWVRT